MHNKIIKFILPLVCVAFLASCSKDEGVQGTQVKPIAGGNVVTIAVGNSEPVTKGLVNNVYTTGRVVASLYEQTGIEGLVLEESVTSLDANASRPATKGTPVYVTNFADVFSAGFVASAVYDWETKAALPDFAPAVFELDGEQWKHDYGSLTLEGKALFYFCAPKDKPEYIGEISYSPADENPSLSFSLIPGNYPKTAVEQQDLVFAASGVEAGKLNYVKFQHAFAEVKFRQGNTDDIFKITKVEMKNMLTSGSCTITPDGEKVAVWSQNEKSYADFSQTYDGKTSYDPEDKYFDPSFYDGTSENRNLSVNGDTKATTTFMCVPQAFSESDAKHVTVVVTYEFGNETRTLEIDFTKLLAGKNKEWKAGQLYTYSFNISDLGVSVEDVSSGDTKSDVVITNTGNRNGYIRAAVVSNWVKEIEGEEVIVGSCDFTTEGTLTGLGTDWIKGTDGYYYYKYAVEGGKATDQALFTSYKAAAAPVEGATLQMTILAQIVSDRSVWSGTPSGMSENTKE